MKFVIINGSMRKMGNTEIMSEYFIKEIKNKNHDACIINLSDRVVNPCRGCDYCKNNHNCIIDDEGNYIIEEIKKANVIVFSTPVYWAGMTGALKNLIDRLNMVPQIGEKVRFGVVLINSEYDSGLNIIQEHFEMIMQYLGINNLGILTISGMKNKGDMLDMKYQKLIRDFTNVIDDRYKTILDNN